MHSLKPGTIGSSSAGSKPARKTTKRAAGLKLIMAAASLGVSLLVAEMLYRSSLRAGGFAGTATPDQYQFYRYDSLLGWANAPGQTGTFKRPEFNYPIEINTHGMRQHELPKLKPARTKRIAVLGDSFIWGIGVADDDRLTELIENRLQSTQVLNFGVSGYAPIQYHLMVPRVMALDPDIIVLVFCLANDFVDNVLFMGHGRYKPYAELEHGKLQVRGHPIPNTRVFGYVAPEPILGSFLLGGAHDYLVDASPPQAGLVAFEPASLYKPDADLPPDILAAKQAAIAINKALMTEISQSFKREGLDVLVVSAPSKREYNPLGETGHVDTYHEAEDILKQTCLEVGLAFLPMVDKLHGDDFWNKDGHWNGSGHAKMAKAISSYLLKSGEFQSRN
jgi:hypothetical protein